jgi:hypothetical protein
LCGKISRLTDVIHEDCFLRTYQSTLGALDSDTTLVANLSASSLKAKAFCLLNNDCQKILVKNSRPVISRRAGRSSNNVSYMLESDWASGRPAPSFHVVSQTTQRAEVTTRAHCINMTSSFMTLFHKTATILLRRTTGLLQ